MAWEDASICTFYSGSNGGGAGSPIVPRLWFVREVHAKPLGTFMTPSRKTQRERGGELQVQARHTAGRERRPGCGPCSIPRSATAQAVCWKGQYLRARSHCNADASGLATGGVVRCPLLGRGRVGRQARHRGASSRILGRSGGGRIWLNKAGSNHA